MRELRKLSVAVAPVWNDERSVQKVAVEQDDFGSDKIALVSPLRWQTGCRAKRRNNVRAYQALFS